MATDITLDDTAVTIDGFTLRFTGADLVLDHAPRRAGATAGVRRALVHGDGDVLRLNFAGDYRGGAQVEGKLLVDVPVLRTGGVKNGRLVGPHYEREPVELGATLRALLDQVEALREQAEALQVRSSIRPALRAESPHFVQAGWRWCHQCSHLHFEPNQARSVCPQTGGTHAAAGSAAYVLFVESSRYGGQPGWGWCRKCQGLCYGSAAQGGVCPAGGPHDRSASPPYLVWAVEDNHAGKAAKDFPSQELWRYCAHCEGMFHGGSPGVCAARNKQPHEPTGSFNYHLQW